MEQVPVPAVHLRFMSLIRPLLLWNSGAIICLKWHFCGAKVVVLV